MNAAILLCFVALIAGASACGPCNTMKWGTCDGEPCECTMFTGSGEKQMINCAELVPKCWLMQAEMYRARNNLSTRSLGGKPVETAFLDNDGIYDPECDNDGKFKAVQCNNTETCWCVNSAGVRRSDKGDKNIKCEPVETYWIRLEMKHKPTDTALDSEELKAGFKKIFLDRYQLNEDLIKNFQYDSNGRLIVVDVEKAKGSSEPDLSRMSYYMEKDVKVLPLFRSEEEFLVDVGGNPVGMENILVYYVDEQAPTFTMKRLTGGVIAVIVVVILIVLVGLLALILARRREKANYSKAQPREMDTMS